MVSLTESAIELVNSAIEMPSHFLDIVLHDPLFNGILILFGALFVGAASAVFGYLSLGAALSLVTRPGSGRSPPPEAK
jgi:urea transporter